MLRSALTIGCVVFATSPAYADDAGVRTWVETTAEGTRLVTGFGDAEPGFGPRVPPEILWQYDEGFAIAQTVALAGASGAAWVGADLNNEALQRFDIRGAGSPAIEFPYLGADFTAVSASRAGDRAAILYRRDGILNLHTFTSSSAAVEWMVDFDPLFTSADYTGVKVSRDGTRVCALVVDPTQGAFRSRLYTYDAVTGIQQSVWETPFFAGPIDLVDDGTQCLVTEGQNAHLIDTNTGTLVRSFVGSGAGARHKISGDGRIVVLGGFSFSVRERDAQGNWSQIISFTSATSWFGWGAAVSRDGSTVAAMSHNYGNNYLSTATRIWDVPTRTRSAPFVTSGSGSFQDSISGAVLSDDGQVLAVSSWGTQDNVHPEVMIFNRNVEMIGSIDLVGSPFGLDMTGQGVYVLSGSKGTHANQFGNGGHATLYQVRCITADFDCNCEVDLSDLANLLVTFGLCEGQPGYVDAYDLNNSNCIDLGDLAILLINFGSRCGA
jgi:hypothetical protein